MNNEMQYGIVADLNHKKNLFLTHNSISKMADTGYESKINTFLESVLQGGKDIPGLLNDITQEYVADADLLATANNVLTHYFPGQADQISTALTILGFIALKSGIVKDISLVRTLKKVIDLQASEAFVPVASVLFTIGSIYDTTVNTLKALTDCKAIEEAHRIVEDIQAQLQSCVEALTKIEELIDEAILGDIDNAELCKQAQRLKELLDTKVERADIAFENFNSNYEQWKATHEAQLTVGEKTNQWNGTCKGIVGATMMTGAATILTGGTGLFVFGLGLVTGAAGAHDIQKSLDYTQALKDLQKLNITVQEIRNNIEYMKRRRELCQGQERKMYQLQ